MPATARRWTRRWPRPAHTVSLTYVINRITAVTMESRAALATYDQVAQSYTLYCGLAEPAWSA